MNQVPPARPEDVTAGVDRTPYGAILRDEPRRRQLVYEAMMAGPDPIGREIGQQLALGATDQPPTTVRPERSEDRRR